jgi:hypothetical protein
LYRLKDILSTLFVDPADSCQTDFVSEFVDFERGSTDFREQFQAMFQAGSRRQFDVLLFWSLDRFSREGVFKTLTHLNRLIGYGVHYRSFTDQWFDSCGIFRDAVVSIMATEGFLQREFRDAFSVAEEKPEGGIFVIPVKQEEFEVPKRRAQWQWARQTLEMRA